MSQRRGTATDQLTNVIQVIQLGRKTGILTVERGEGATLEEGEIIFVQGQISQARGGQFSGQKALNWLSTWGACRFTFVPTTSQRTTRTLPEQSRTSPTQPLADTNSYPSFHPSLEQKGTVPGPGDSQQPLPIGPRRIRQGDEAIRLLDLAGLSRLHRHLFLLIDGRRSLPELVRLMGRRQDEVQKLLRDLEYIGVIQL